MEEILRIENLKKKFPKNRDFFGRSKGWVFALNGVNLTINKGDSMGLVGESGCGKSTVGRCILKLIEPTEGNIFFNGQKITAIKNSEFKTIRPNLQIVFQNPYSSLNPRMKIKDILEEPLKINTKSNKKERRGKILEVLEMVGLGEDILDNFPHEFSGGQRQRIVIAKALILNPEFIVADEPISALDISIQAQIINLLKELKEKFNLTYLFISHDLGTVKHFCNKVAVMYLGEIIEFAQTNELFDNPLHPYSKLLLGSRPLIGVNKIDRENIIDTEPPSNENLPGGCKFASRCAYKMDICTQKEPPDIQISPSHSVKCFLYNEQKEQ
ncbi:MAG: ABC transporter ATP-binding protein [Candidatus Gastranaerophilales bacterium]|nr:ABC transporter ATP-binding protein [Candidatus Gastranaerophilales bacterium]